MVKDKPEPGLNINKTLKDLKTAMNNLEKTVNLLQNTENNMQVSKENYNKVMLKQQKEKIVRYGYYGIQSLEEKASEIENEYITLIIEDKSVQEVIVFSPKEKGISK